MNRIHRISAYYLLAFASLHIFNHFSALNGISAHLQVMSRLRLIYRHPIAENLLFAAVLIQVLSGVYFVVRNRKQRSFVARLQRFSGLYMAFFLINHVGAVLYGRHILNLDTNFYFAATGLNSWPHILFFLPYYGLAIIALFTHVACALHFASGGMYSTGLLPASKIILILGIFVAGALLSVFSGWLFPIQIPAEYTPLLQFF